MSHASPFESTIRGFANALSRALSSERVASQPGFLQRLDPRIRLLGILMLIVSVVLSRRLDVILGLLLLATLIATMSGVRIQTLARRVWIVVLAFTGLIAAPALFVTPGPSIVTLPWLHVSISATGLRTAAFLVLRAETAVTLTTVLVLCTPWNGILKALRSLHVPAEAITMLAMTHRYLFLLIDSTNEMFEARQSRTVGHLAGREKRRMMTSTAAVMLSKSINLSEDVYLAMLSRGFTGEVRLLTEPHMKTRDYLALAGFCATSLGAAWLGR